MFGNPGQAGSECVPLPSAFTSRTEHAAVRVEGAGAGGPAWPCRLAVPLLRQGSVQLSPRVAFLWVTGKARALGGASRSPGPAIVCWACWPPGVAPLPPTPPGPPPRGSAGVYRKCRTRLGGGWRGPGRCVLARLVGLRAGAPLPTPRTRLFVVAEGKGPTSRAALPLPGLFPPGRHTLPASQTPASPPLLPREAPEREGKKSPELGDSSICHWSFCLGPQFPHLLNGRLAAAPANPQQCSQPWCSPAVRRRADGPASPVTQGVQAGLAYTTATFPRSLCMWSPVKMHPGSTSCFSKPEWELERGLASSASMPGVRYGLSGFTSLISPFGRQGFYLGQEDLDLGLGTALCPLRHPEQIPRHLGASVFPSVNQR